MRRYLLGTLPEPDAQALEQRYFGDPAFFEWMWGLEDRLIADYLAGRLPSSESAQFERRYLEIPALQKRLEEVRQRKGKRRPEGLYAQWVFVVTAALVICFAAVYFRTALHRPAPPSPTLATITAERPLLAMRLTPGVSKGSSSQLVELAPPAGGRVQLSFELPGRSTVKCQVAIARINSDGRRVDCLDQPATRITAVGHRQ